MITPEAPSVAGLARAAVESYAQALAAPKGAEDALPPLPEPAYFVAEDAKRHGMYPCYRRKQTWQQYSDEGRYEFGYTAEQMHAYARAAQQSKEPT